MILFCGCASYVNEKTAIVLEVIENKNTHVNLKYVIRINSMYAIDAYIYTDKKYEVGDHLFKGEVK